MKRELVYERCQTAGRMEAFMIIMTGAAFVASVVAFFRHGWLAALGLLILGSVAFALARLFDLIGDLFTAMREPGKGEDRQPSAR